MGLLLVLNHPVLKINNLGRRARALRQLEYGQNELLLYLNLINSPFLPAANYTNLHSPHLELL